MEKQTLLALVMLILSVMTVTASIEIKPQDLGSGYQPVTIIFYNSGHSLPDSNVLVYMPELGVYQKTSGADIRSRASTRLDMELNMPTGYKADYYPVIIRADSARNDRTMHGHTWIYYNP